MRKTFLIISYIFTLLSILFAVLPMNTIAFAPIVLALIFIFLTFIKSDQHQKRTTKFLFIVVYLCIATVLIKIFFFKDEVEVDQQFEQQKIETKQEAKKELEELEKDLEKDLQ